MLRIDQQDFKENTLLVLDDDRVKLQSGCEPRTLICPDIKRVAAIKQEQAEQVMRYDPEPAQNCESVLAWRPETAGDEQSFTGKADDIDGLAEVLVSKVSGLMGKNLILHQFVKKHRHRCFE